MLPSASTAAAAGNNDASAQAGGSPPPEEQLTAFKVAHATGPAPRAAGAGQATPPRHARPLLRYPERGLLGGVCAGVALHTGVDLRLVRLVMAMVILAGGAGLAVYALAWALIPVAPESEGAPRRPGAWLRALVTVLALLAALGGLRAAGLRFGDAVLWPLVLGACGMALAWRLTGGSSAAWEEPALDPDERRRGRGSSRVVLAALLVALAASALLRTFGVLHDVGREIGAVAIFATLLALLVVPWVARLARSLSFERAARIREQERAELAAHLHDSVLQTLALIQRRAGDAREVATLARRQERELRRWLFGRTETPAVDSLRAELTRVAAEVEELHGVPIEVVVVGDGPLNVPRRALVQAAREALTNASKFAGSERVDLYAEITPERVEAFVRDRGVGFDPAAVPPDRAGVRESILARMERNGGRARVSSAPGQGTEVELVLEQLSGAREPAASAAPGSP